MSSFVRIIASLLCVAVMISAPQVSWAQARGTSTEKSTGGPRRQIATIIFAGLGGAILGLSTLSFYPRPQDKLGNIATGFAVGVIVGTGLVTYQAATNPGSMYGSVPMPSIEDRPYQEVTSQQAAINLQSSEMNRLQAKFVQTANLPSVFRWSWTF
jgi:hypothetical protein